MKRNQDQGSITKARDHYFPYFELMVINCYRCQETERFISKKGLSAGQIAAVSVSVVTVSAGVVILGTQTWKWRASVF